MPDVYAAIDAASEPMQARLADVLELRAADPQQRSMLADYLGKIPLPPNTRALEIDLLCSRQRSLSSVPAKAPPVRLHSSMEQTQPQAGHCSIIPS
jgi:hypothetical protein